MLIGALGALIKSAQKRASDATADAMIIGGILDAHEARS
tara:strand:- start:757 stop:873 length:117 start_codon:yes stop_codon:yes gene_type:complete